jgi:hypothetical protein
MPGSRSFASREQRRQQALGVPEVQFGNAMPTFRAAMRGDLTYDHNIYPSDLSSGDLVWWDYWNEDFDTRFFSTDALDDTIDGVPVVGGVELLVPGKYAVYCQIEFDKLFSGMVRMQLNYDDGQGDTQYIDQASGGDSVACSISRSVYLWDLFTVEETFVYITIYHNADVGDLTIPGGFNGYWGVVPVFYVSYIGGFDGPPNFGEDAGF